MSRLKVVVESEISRILAPAKHCCVLQCAGAKVAPISRTVPPLPDGCWLCTSHGSTHVTSKDRSLVITAVLHHKPCTLAAYPFAACAVE